MSPSTSWIVMTLVSAGLWVGVVSLPAQAEEIKKTKQRSDVYDGNADMKLGEYQGIKHAIGVRDFENDAGYRGQWKLGANLSIMLESALYDTGRFVIVEREKLGHVLVEQDLAASGRMAEAKQVAQTGKLRPAKYLGTGALVEVEENESGIGGGLALGPVRLGGKHKKAQLTIIAKLVDTTTGEIVAKQRIVGKSGSTALNVGASRGGYGGDIGGFVKTPLGEAAQDCINQAAKFFAEQMAEYPTDGSVVAVVNGRVIINRGSEYGFRPGMTLTVNTEGQELIDPDTGQLLGRVPGKQIGAIRVADVQEKISLCEVVEGDANPPRGASVSVASVPPAAEANK